jgi:phosphocarrier protein
MIQESVIVSNKLGLHARASAKFVQLASAFKSDIELSLNGQTVNGKSIMGIMMLAASKGSELTISADGADETQALSELVTLVNSRFGEAE